MGKAGIALGAAMAVTASWSAAQPAPRQPALGTRDIPILSQGGLRFRDLDRDGRLAPYEDWRLSPALRAADLTRRMTLEEKAGTMFHGTLPNLPGGASGYDLAAFEPMVADRHVTSFITRLSASPAAMAEQNNLIQARAEHGRLGIPLTISTDPRNHFQRVLGASTGAAGYSQWPEPLGFAALRDPALVRRFADEARAEYRASGIHQALSPQADLVTEPRWPRGTATFGANPMLVRDMVGAYVEGFQGSAQGLARDGVLTTVKHWVGYGATREGWDGRNYYGRYADPGRAFLPAHVEAFAGAFRANVGAVMPTYSIVRGTAPDGAPFEEVGAGFSKQMLTGLLRGRMGFRGIVLSDWGIINDCTAECRAPTRAQGLGSFGTPWGVEDMAKPDRIVKGIEAGIDQFGGVVETEMLVALVRAGRIGEARIDQTVERLLEPKFRMGLFENPYVDPARAAALVADPALRAEARRVQAAAQVLLKNDRLLPLRAGTRVWLKDIDPAAARAQGLVPVDTPAEAQVALVRASTPSEKVHPNAFFGSRQNEGRLDFRNGEATTDLVMGLPPALPVVLALFADRPPVLGPLDARSGAILVNFGVGDDALLDAVTGKVMPRGRLPFELPSSMAAVAAQDPGLPDDSASPLYQYGAGMVPPR